MAAYRVIPHGRSRIRLWPATACQQLNLLINIYEVRPSRLCGRKFCEFGKREHISFNEPINSSWSALRARLTPVSWRLRAEGDCTGRTDFRHQQLGVCDKRRATLDRRSERNWTVCGGRCDDCVRRSWVGVAGAIDHSTTRISAAATKHIVKSLQTRGLAVRCNSRWYPTAAGLVLTGRTLH